MIGFGQMSSAGTFIWAFTTDSLKITNYISLGNLALEKYKDSLSEINTRLTIDGEDKQVSLKSKESWEKEIGEKKIVKILAKQKKGKKLKKSSLAVIEKLNSLNNEIERCKVNIIRRMDEWRIYNDSVAIIKSRNSGKQRQLDLRSKILNIIRKDSSNIIRGDFSGSGLDDGKHHDDRSAGDGGRCKLELTNQNGDGVLSFYYHRTNQKKSEANYKDGKKEGLTTTWHRNGEMSSQVHFKNNVENGILQKWTQEGDLCWKVEYIDGVPKGDNPYNYIENCLVGYDWCNPNCSNPISAWKFAADRTFNFSTTMFGGMSAWGTWEDIGSNQIELIYTKTSTGDVVPKKIVSMPDCKSFQVGSTLYIR